MKVKIKTKSLLKKMKKTITNIVLNYLLAKTIYLI